MRFACAYPLYVSYCESTAQRPGRRLKFVVLTHYGFLVACNESVVLSAYFKASANRSSPCQCFETASLGLRQRCLAAAYSRPDGTRVNLHDVVRHNNHTWSHMPRWCDIAPPDIVPEPSPRAATFFIRPDLWSPLQAHVKSRAS